jgi:transcriptional regulator with XRE-family HTH domain
MAAATTAKPPRDIRAARERAGLTRVQLASRVGCSLSQLGALESGYRPRQSAVLERVRDVLAKVPEGRAR